MKKHTGMFFQLIFIFTLGSYHSGIASAQETDLQFFSLDSLLNVKISAAAKYEQTISEAPASVTIITSEDIERYGYRTFDELLASVRGFYTRNDRTYTRIGVRGFSRPSDYNNRILLLINGLTINESLYGAVFLGSELGMNLDIIDRVEIVRGPGSALYGTGAMLAVINIITKKNILNSVDIYGGDFKLAGGYLSLGKQTGMMKNNISIHSSRSDGYMSNTDFITSVPTGGEFSDNTKLR